MNTSIQGVGYGSDSVGSGGISVDKRALEDFINAACCRQLERGTAYLRMIKDQVGEVQQIVSLRYKLQQRVDIGSPYVPLPSAHPLWYSQSTLPCPCSPPDYSPDYTPYSGSTPRPGNPSPSPTPLLPEPRLYSAARLQRPALLSASL